MSFSSILPRSFALESLDRWRMSEEKGAMMRGEERLLPQMNGCSLPARARSNHLSLIIHHQPKPFLLRRGKSDVIVHANARHPFLIHPRGSFQPLPCLGIVFSSQPGQPEQPLEGRGPLSCGRGVNGGGCLRSHFPLEFRREHEVEDLPRRRRRRRLLGAVRLHIVESAVRT